MQRINFVALDCETTGLNSEKDNLIELGAVKFSILTDEASFDSLFHSPTRIPQFVEQLTGISNADLENAPKFSGKQTEFAEFCRDAILVGHNLQFDIDFLASAGLDLSSQPQLDTFQLAGLLLPRGEGLSLMNLAARFGVAHSEAHRALADAEATRDLLRAFLGLAQNFSQAGWQQIADLKSTEESWVQSFARLVLANPNFEKKDFPAPVKTEQAVSNPKLLEKLKALSVHTPALLEVMVSAPELVTTVEALEQPATIFFGSNFSARAAPGEQIFSATAQVDPEKLTKFLAQELSSAETSLAAKLILHTGANSHELNLTRPEGLLFDWVGRRGEVQLPESKVLTSDHASLPKLLDSTRLTIIADAATLPENLTRAQTLILDLITLETLVSQHAEKVSIWWGLLGLLIREAAPQFGRLNLAELQGQASYQKAIEAGRSFLAAARADLPPRLSQALENFLGDSPDFQRTLRINALNEITLVLEPVTSEMPDLTNAILLDAALDANDNFAFVRKTLRIPEELPAEKLPTEGELPQFIVGEGLPKANTPKFIPAATKTLLKLLIDLDGLTVVVFPNRLEAGTFAERAAAETGLPVFFRKIPSNEQLAEFDRAVVLLTPGSRLLPIATHNFVLVKLPFFVRDGADFGSETLPATMLRFKKMWADFATLPEARKFISLDPRLLDSPRDYGKGFILAIPQKFETLSC